MARERLSTGGLLAAFTASVVVAHIPLTGKFIDPRALNPYRAPDPPNSKLARVKAAMTAIHLRVLADDNRPSNG